MIEEGILTNLLDLKAARQTSKCIFDKKGGEGREDCQKLREKGLINKKSLSASANRRRPKASWLGRLAAFWATLPTDIKRPCLCS